MRKHLTYPKKELMIMENDEISEELEFLDIFKSSSYIEKKRIDGMWYDHQAEEYFSYVIRDLKHDGFVATDIDFVFYSYKSHKLLYLDHKTRNCKFRKGQENIYKLLDGFTRIAVKTPTYNHIKYMGVYQLVFENTTFEDGNVWLVKPFDENWEKKQIINMEDFQKIIKRTF